MIILLRLKVEGDLFWILGDKVKFVDYSFLLF